MCSITANNPQPQVIPIIEQLKLSKNLKMRKMCSITSIVSTYEQAMVSGMTSLADPPGLSFARYELWQMASWRKKLILKTVFLWKDCSKKLNLYLYLSDMNIDRWQAAGENVFLWKLNTVFLWKDCSKNDSNLHWTNYYMCQIRVWRI